MTHLIPGILIYRFTEIYTEIKKHTLPFIMLLFDRSQSFHQYLVDWDQYIQKNNLTDWFDDEPDLKADLKSRKNPLKDKDSVF